MVATAAVLSRRSQDITWITLNRPQALNALDFEMLAGVREGLAGAGDDPVVLSGQGRAFSSGGDLRFVNEHIDEPEVLAAFFHEAAQLILAIAGHPRPIVAAVNGVAVAGGLEMVLACDAAVAAEGAELGDGHIRWGMVPGGGASHLLRLAVGSAVARWLLLSGDTVGAEEARRLGLVKEVVPAAVLLERAGDLAGRLGSMPSGATARIKRLLVRDLASPLEAERRALLAQLQTDEPRRLLMQFAARKGGKVT